MMSDQSDILTQTLAQIGLEASEVQIYLHLLQKGTKSALEISRSLHVARTRVYRLLDKLQSRGLVTQKFDTLGLKFSSSPASQIQLLVAKRQSELDAFKSAMPAVLSELEIMSRAHESGSKVYYHHGIDGLKHVTWNSIRAKEILRIYEVSENMTAFLPQEFSESVREEFARKKTTIHQLTNERHIGSYTKVLDSVKLCTTRFMSAKELAIKSEILIYNDTTAIYHYQNSDIFCVEIENPDLATMQKQLFDFIWTHAKPMKKVGIYGEARV